MFSPNKSTKPPIRESLVQLCFTFLLAAEQTESGVCQLQK